MVEKFLQLFFQLFFPEAPRKIFQNTNVTDLP